jgi:hypothetical protein
MFKFFFIGGILPKRIFQKHFSSKKEIPSTGIEATIPTAPVKAIATHFFFSRRIFVLCFNYLDIERMSSLQLFSVLKVMNGGLRVFQSRVLLYIFVRRRIEGCHLKKTVYENKRLQFSPICITENN